MREIVHLQAGQCGNQIGAKVSLVSFLFSCLFLQFVLFDFFFLDFGCFVAQVIYAHCPKTFFNEFPN